jgi:transcriptional regulator with XRE-family HTH domain
VAGLLPHLGRVCREARVNAGLRQIDVATAAGTSHASLSRFETGRYWPKNPDAWVDAYAAETGIEPLDLWAAAVEAWRASG